MKAKFDARKLMEQAVEAMRQSIPEPREDSKASPKVGVVLWRPDGSIDSACRGELRDGDHAEFTLLERKNRSNNLDGCILFATLEPCAPGSRHPPKMSCAERIVLARIKEVWIGIEDPDPTVDRKGIRYLQDSGVEVHMFDRDLQEVIHAENRDFLKQALERAASDREEPPKEIVLSTLEGPLPATLTEDLSVEALERYCAIAGIDLTVSSASLNRRLMQQGVLKQEGGQFIPTGFGMLLFGREPRTSLPQAGLLATIHYPDGTDEPEDFDGPMVLVPEQLEKWLGDKLPNVIDRSTMRRKRVPPLPFEMVREAVVNALIHRDYDIRQAKCQLVVTPDTITVKSPGGPVPPITMAQLQAFNAPMLSRNPELHYVFAQMGMAEERGLGIRALAGQAQELGLPLPRYAWNEPYVELTLFRSPEAAAHALGEGAADSMSKLEQKGWQWLVAQGSVTASEYARAVGIPKRTALNHLKRFVELGVLLRTGTGRATRYEVAL